MRNLDYMCKNREPGRRGLRGPVSAPRKQDYTGGDRNIQRSDLASHGNPDQEIAVLPDEVVQALAFSAHYDGGALSPIDLMNIRFASLIHSVDEKTGVSD